MIFTIRLQDERNVEFQLDTTERTLYIIDPIPDITIKELCALADKFHYNIGLPLIDTIIHPDNEITTDELDEDYTIDSIGAIFCILTFANMIITGD